MSPGSTLATGYLTGREIRNLRAFCFASTPARPGDRFPRASGLRFTCDPDRPAVGRATEVALGDIDRGCAPIDNADAQTLCGVTCPLFFARMVAANPALTEGRLELVAENRDGAPLRSRVEAIALPAPVTPDLLPQAGTRLDMTDGLERTAEGPPVETEEREAIMRYLKALPAEAPGALPVVPMDARAGEARVIRVGAGAP